MDTSRRITQNGTNTEGANHIRQSISHPTNPTRSCHGKVFLGKSTSILSNQFRMSVMLTRFRYARFHRCEERFMGYGHNKIACAWSLYLHGIDFWVLPEDFMIHQDHAYVEKEKAFDVSLGTTCHLPRKLNQVYCTSNITVHAPPTGRLQSTDFQTLGSGGLHPVSLG